MTLVITRLFPPAPVETTFLSYTKEQGTKYAQIRPGYHPKLYNLVIDYHTTTGGQLNTVVDVGCGPGIATRALAPFFKQAIGLDPSEGMISVARGLADCPSLRFETAGAEDLGAQLKSPIEDESVDLITAATAAHWFDMSLFWHSAARVLKPGGSVALWSTSTSSIQVHPSMPNAVAIQAAIDRLEAQEIGPYLEQGNRIMQDKYASMPLPWTLHPPVPGLTKANFFRKEWGLADSGEFFAEGVLTVDDMDTMESQVNARSSVQRWRLAHPKDVGTERDYSRVLRREIERLLHQVGVEKGHEVVKRSLTGVLLVVKKRA